MSDRRSVGSGSGSSYRRVSSGSSVDETLFASSHKHSVSRLRDAREKKLIGRNDRSESKQEVVLTRRQLDAIKARAIFASQEAEEKQREEEEARKEKMAKAKARKERMLQLEAERAKKKNLTVEEEEDEAKTNATLARAKDMRIENLDQIKTMRRKMMYAQCAKVRESQIKEKEERKNMAKAFEERSDILMEIDRLKELKRTEETKRINERQRREDAKKIRGQIEERERQRILQEELLEQERQQMKRMIAQQEQEALEKKKAHAKASKELLNTVLQANEEAIELKQRRRLEEKEDDERILRWQEAKRLQEEKIEMEKLAIKQEKDRKFFEVASQMKRSMDNRSEQDALRAKRHQQEQERKERERERKEREKRLQRLEDLKRARGIQHQEKIENLKILALADKEEWEKINRENAVIQARIDEREHKIQRQNLSHQRELREQIRVREREAAQRRQELHDEGERLRKENEAFLRTIEKKKREILQEMRDADIPDKFCAEVARMKISLQ